MQHDYFPTLPAEDRGFGRWFDERLPITRLVYDSFVAYPIPRNLNYWYTFGGILAFMLAVQIVTGIVLAMHYVAHADLAFDSVEQIMRDVNYGWLLRYLHANGASMFFLAVYIHIFRGLYYGSYKAPREVLWILGVIIFLLMMATAFMGYVLPWGQMSFWGATVITNLFSAIPLVGEAITTWLWGGFAVGDPTLNRFFSLHYLLPFMIAGVVVLHIWALHVAGQTNPTGIEVKSKQDAVPFTPHATMKDGFSLVALPDPLRLVRLLPCRTISATRTTTSRPIRWRRRRISCRNGTSCRSTRSCAPSRTSSLGVIVMFGSIAVLFLVPWLDTSRVRSATYRPLYRQFFWIFVVVVHRARLSRLAAAGGRLCHRRAHPDRLLLPPLPGHHAAARPVRDAEAAAGLDRRCGARPRQAARRRRQRRRA